MFIFPHTCYCCYGLCLDSFPYDNFPYKGLKWQMLLVWLFQYQSALKTAVWLGSHVLPHFSSNISRRYRLEVSHPASQTHRLAHWHSAVEIRAVLNRTPPDWHSNFTSGPLSPTTLKISNVFKGRVEIVRYILFQGLS